MKAMLIVKKKGKGGRGGLKIWFILEMKLFVSLQVDIYFAFILLFVVENELKMIGFFFQNNGTSKAISCQIFIDVVSRPWKTSVLWIVFRIIWFILLAKNQTSCSAPYHRNINIKWQTWISFKAWKESNQEITSSSSTNQDQWEERDGKRHKQQWTIWHLSFAERIKMVQR